MDKIFHELRLLQEQQYHLETALELKLDAKSMVDTETRVFDNLQELRALIEQKVLQMYV
jgi:hypothetical protein